MDASLVVAGLFSSTQITSWHMSAAVFVMFRLLLDSVYYGQFENNRHINYSSV